MIKRNISKRGFTLVEVVVAVAILAVIMAVFVPSMAQYMEKSRAAKDNSAMSEITNAIKMSVTQDADVYDEVYYLAKTVEEDDLYIVYYEDNAGEGLAPHIFEGEPLASHAPKLVAKLRTYIRDLYVLESRSFMEQYYTVVLHKDEDGEIREITGSWDDNKKENNEVTTPAGGQQNHGSQEPDNLSQGSSTSTGAVSGTNKPSMLASGYNWFNPLNGLNDRASITAIHFVKTYAPDSSVKATWNADADDMGKIMCYATDSELYVSSNGANTIIANPSCARMFKDFTELTTITGIEMLDTSRVEDMTQMFESCTKLTSLDVTHFTTSSVTNMLRMFENCRELTSLDLSRFDTSKVTNMSSMFSYCKKLNYLNLTGLDTANVTNMESMFYHCEQLPSLDVSSFVTSKVQSMKIMFARCSSLTTLNINFNTIGVTDMAGMFQKCSSLQELHLNNFNTYNVVDTSYMFADCSSLRNLSLRYCNFESTTNMNEMFMGCTARVIIPNMTGSLTNKSGVYETGKAGGLLYGANSEICAEPGKVSCEFITMAEIPAPMMAAGSSWYNSATPKSAFKTIEFVRDFYLEESLCECWSADIGKTGAIEVHIVDDKLVISVNEASRLMANENSSHMFDGFVNVTQIIGLDLLDTSTVKNMEGMFYHCESLTQLNVRNFDTFSANSMKLMFGSCKSLTSLDVSSFDTTAVTDMDGMFEFCSSLKELNLSNFRTTRVKQMGGMFTDCTSLETLDVSQFNTSRVQNMMAMFAGCKSLKALDLTKFRTSSVESMAGMFCECESLTNLNLSKFDTSKVATMDSMFEECHSLKKLDIHNFEMSNVDSLDAMFAGCPAQVTIPVKSGEFTNEITINSNLGKLYGSRLSVVADAGTYNAATRCTFNTLPMLAPFDCWYQSSQPKSNITAIEIAQFYDFDNPSAEHWAADVDGVGTIDAYILGTKLVLTTNGAPEIITTKLCADMFAGFSNVTRIDGLEMLNTQYAEDMTFMFGGCSSLTELDLCTFNTKNVTTMEAMFIDCSSLRTLNVNNFITSNVTNMKNMFAECESLQELSIFRFDTSKVTQMTGMFQGVYCDINIPEKTGSLDNLSGPYGDDTGYLYGASKTVYARPYRYKKGHETPTFNFVVFMDKAS